MLQMVNSVGDGLWESKNQGVSWAGRAVAMCAAFLSPPHPHSFAYPPHPPDVRAAEAVQAHGC